MTEKTTGEAKADAKAAPAVELDLGSLDTIKAANGGAEVELRHPTKGTGLGIFVGILGQDSDTFREAIRERENEARQKRAMADRSGKTAPTLSSEELEEQATDLLILCTTHWRTGDKPTLKLDGEEMTFNVPNARKAYTRLLWMRTQVDAAIGNLALFIKT